MPENPWGLRRARHAAEEQVLIVDAMACPWKGAQNYRLVKCCAQILESDPASRKVQGRAKASDTMRGRPSCR